MMISYQKVISKIKEEVEKAEQTPDPQRISEHARAIRLLCDLILDDGDNVPAQIVSQPKTAQPTIDQLELQQMMGTTYQSPPTNHPSVNPEKMGSLLDF